MGRTPHVRAAEADHTVLLLPGALCTPAFYDDLLAEPRLSALPIEIPEVGHFALVQQPGRVADVILEAIAAKGRPRYTSSGSVITSTIAGPS